MIEAYLAAEFHMVETDMVSAVLFDTYRMSFLGKNMINSLDKDDYERWSWDGWNKIGASFATSPPDDRNDQG